MERDPACTRTHTWCWDTLGHSQHHKPGSDHKRAEPRNEFHNSCLARILHRGAQARAPPTPKARTANLAPASCSACSRRAKASSSASCWEVMMTGRSGPAREQITRVTLCTTSDRRGSPLSALAQVHKCETIWGRQCRRPQNLWRSLRAAESTKAACFSRSSPKPHPALV